jgi:hypothetical protein
MSYDDYYPTTSSAKVASPGWSGTSSYECLEKLRSQDLLTDPKGYLCPSLGGLDQAKMNDSLKNGNVSYNWVDGLMGATATISPVAADGKDNHGKGAVTGRFVRGDGSVGVANSTTTLNWYSINTELQVPGSENQPSASYRKN